MKGTLALAALLTLAFSNPTPAADGAGGPEPAVDSLLLDQLDDYIQQEERHRALALESRTDQVSPMLRADHDHMECVKHGTCGPMTNYICTSNC